MACAMCVLNRHISQRPSVNVNDDRAVLHLCTAHTMYYLYAVCVYVQRFNDVVNEKNCTRFRMTMVTSVSRVFWFFTIAKNCNKFYSTYVAVKIIFITSFYLVVARKTKPYGWASSVLSTAIIVIVPFSMCRFDARKQTKTRPHTHTHPNS